MFKDSTGVHPDCKQRLLFVVEIQNKNVTVSCKPWFLLKTDPWLDMSDRFVTVDTFLEFNKIAYINGNIFVILDC